MFEMLLQSAPVWDHGALELQPQPGTAGKLLLNSVVLLDFTPGSTTGLKPEHKVHPGLSFPEPDPAPVFAFHV